MRETDQPKCFGKCNTCFYNQINGCVALPGDDFYLNFSDREIQAIRRSNYYQSLQERLQFVRTKPAARIIA